MSLVEWNPFRDIENMSRDMGHFFERSPFRFLYGVSSPRVDVYQSNNNVVVKAEIPGVSKEDLNVYVDENSIRLSGQTRKDTEFTADNAYRAERYYGSFSRTIPLPVEIKADQVKADYRDGILSVTAPIMESAKTKGRRIDIH